MTILRWRDPFESSVFKDLGRLQEEVNSLFHRFGGRRSLMSSAGVFPPVNVSHDENNIYVEAEMPGVTAKEIDITIEEDTLILKGSRQTEPAKENVSFHRRERETGTFGRSITLPTRVQADKVVAQTRGGILTLVLPKAEEVKPKKIEIKVG